MSEENNKDIKGQKSVDANSEEVVDNKEKKEENEGKKEESNIQISNDVVASIAGMAAAAVPGVAEMAGGFAGGISEVLSGKKNMAKGIKVDVTDNNVKVDVNIIVEYGSRIPDVAYEIQNRVKKSVENMTGLKATEVNVHVQGVSALSDESTDEKPEDKEKKSLKAKRAERKEAKKEEAASKDESKEEPAESEKKE